MHSPRTRPRPPTRKPPTPDPTPPSSSPPFDIKKDKRHSSPNPNFHSLPPADSSSSKKTSYSSVSPRDRSSRSPTPTNGLVSPTRDLARSSGSISPPSSTSPRSLLSHRKTPPPKSPKLTSYSTFDGIQKKTVRHQPVVKITSTSALSSQKDRPPTPKGSSPRSPRSPRLPSRAPPSPNLSTRTPGSQSQPLVTSSNSVVSSSPSCSSQPPSPRRPPRSQASPRRMPPSSPSFPSRLPPPCPVSPRTPSSSSSSSSSSSFSSSSSSSSSVSPRTCGSAITITSSPRATSPRPLTTSTTNFPPLSPRRNGPPPRSASPPSPSNPTVTPSPRKKRKEKKEKKEKSGRTSPLSPKNLLSPKGGSSFSLRTSPRSSPRSSPRKTSPHDPPQSPTIGQLPPPTIPLLLPPSSGSPPPSPRRSPRSPRSPRGEDENAFPLSPSSKNAQGKPLARYVDFLRNSKKDDKKLKSFLRSYAKMTSKNTETLIPPTEFYWLSFQIMEARNLPGTCDPFCIVTLDGEFYRTRTLWATREPFWAETFETGLTLASREALCSLTLWDTRKLTSDRPLGQFVRGLDEIPRGKTVEEWVGLTPFSSREFVCGKLQVMIMKQHLALGVGVGVFTGVRVMVIQGRNLPSKDVNRLSDPFVKVQIGETKKKTKYVSETLNPIWDDVFDFTGVKSSSILTLRVFDRDRLSSNDFMGQVSIPLAEIFASSPHDSVFMGWFPLSLPPPEEIDPPLRSSGPSNSGKDSTLSPRPQSPKRSVSSYITSPYVTRREKKGAEIRVRYCVHEEVLLSHGDYEPFLKLLIKNREEIFDLASQAVPQSEMLLFSKTFLNIFSYYGAEIDLLKQVCEAEVKQSQLETLFRGNSVCTKMVDHYFKLVGMPYLHKTLRSFITQVYGLKKSCEMDPSRFTKQDENADKNKELLLSLMGRVLNDIFHSVSSFPQKLKDVMALIRENCDKAFVGTGDETTSFTCISCFVFLRYFVAAILGPNLFGFTKERPSLIAERALTLVAKTLQNLANFCDFGPKEPFMTSLNPFLATQTENMKTYLEHLSLPSDSTAPPPFSPKRERDRDFEMEREIALGEEDQEKENNNNKIAEEKEESPLQKLNPLKELATLHRLLEDLLPSMQKISEEKGKGEEVVMTLKGVLEGVSEKVEEFKQRKEEDGMSEKQFQCVG